MLLGAMCPPGQHEQVAISTGQALAQLTNLTGLRAVCRCSRHILLDVKLSAYGNLLLKAHQAHATDIVASHDRTTTNSNHIHAARLDCSSDLLQNIAAQFQHN